MIIVVEGVSASGKTTWCQRQYPELTIPESPPLPDSLTRPERVQAWQELNASRWRQAIKMEERQGFAVCDSDPFKLHYSWSLLMIGQIDKEEWEQAKQLARQSFAMQRLGIADFILVATPDPDTLDHRHRNDKPDDAAISNYIVN
jgi:hypothetical protein